jgi:hypothetical protein
VAKLGLEPWISRLCGDAYPTEPKLLNIPLAQFAAGKLDAIDVGNALAMPSRSSESMPQ